MGMVDLPEVVVLNLHKRYTGVSASIKHVVPIQQQTRTIGVVDSGKLGLHHTIPLWHLLVFGWQTPKRGHRILHARRCIDMYLGLFLKYALRQPWRLVFTSAAPRRHGRILSFIIRQMDGIIATSKRAASFLDWHSVIVHHGVDVERFVPGTWPMNPPYQIGVFGRIRPSKGTDLLIDALIEVLPQYPDWSVFFTGLAKDPEYLKAQQEKIQHAGLQQRITFLGDLPSGQIVSQYQRCHLVVAASRQEGFGLTPLEAMACGVPVITSTAGFWPELIKKDTHGELFESGDLAGLIKALKCMLAKPKALQALGQKARSDMCQHHSIAQEVKGIHAFYDRMLS